MSKALRVIVEVGKKRRFVAGAIDWPGLDRSGTSEESALATLATYVPRYAGVAERVGRGRELVRQQVIDVVERVPGSSSTDFWGIAHVPSQIEHEVLSAKELEQRLDLLQACWAYFDDVAHSITGPLRPTVRGRGRPHEAIVRHVYATEPENWSRKVEVRTPRETVLTADGLAAHRQQYLDAIRTYNADGRMARTSPIQFLIRRTAQHVMDHAWEMEDRGPDAG